ncbi:hypothetical protein [Crenobacter caeni]|uniref:Uncharacterized protein n=1 Tax=Crenobacter caeni TaxID=2705474 RepID=A0A6B2KW25_9NEIS|nr:hypothetical protein [Crenobacter caeni]NDV14381.1 hypothetical protein [Crenobacter caeni]
MDDQAFLRQLESGRLPAEALNHEARLYAAWAYRRGYPAREAAARCAHALSRRALSLGHADRYHHTLTMALLFVLYSRVTDNPGLLDDWHAFRDACLDVLDGAADVVAAHYSTERLDDDFARRAFVEPDRLPLPTSGLLH